MYGGTCINVACIPTKSLIINAEKGIPYPETHHIKDDLTQKLREKNYHKIADLKNATVIDGTASFLSPTSIKVTTEQGEQVITADRIFINTGTKPRLPEIAGARGKRVYNSTTLMELEEKPGRLAIIGGGFVGLKFADMFLKFGSEVTLFDRSETFLPKEDRDMAEAIRDLPVKKSLTLISGVTVGNPSERSVADLSRTEKVWAIGDVNGGPQFTYISLDDFRIIKNQIAGGNYNSTKKRKVFATTLFTTPPYARVGLNEQEAKEEGLDYSVRTLSAADIPKAAVLQQKQGLLKAVIEKGSGQILGCMLLCAEAHELINMVQIAMNAGIS